MSLSSHLLKSSYESFSSVQFSRSVVSNSLRPHESQHARPPCPSPTPKLMCIELVMPSSHLILCRPLLLLPPIPPSIRVFSNESTLCMRWPKYWGFSLIISPSNEQEDWFPLRWTGWISLQSKGLSRVFSNTTVKSINSSVLSFLHSPALLYKYYLLPSSWSPSCFLALLCSPLPWVFKKYIYIIWKAYSSPVLPYSVRPHSGYLHTLIYFLL